MYSGEFSHQGDSCTFEVIARRFRLQSVAVVKVGQVVHDLDIKDTKFGLPEAAAVGRMVEGLQALYGDDSRLLEHGIGMFEALSSSFGSDERGSRRVKADRTGTPAIEIQDQTRRPGSRAEARSTTIGRIRDSRFGCGRSQRTQRRRSPSGIPEGANLLEDVHDTVFHDLCGKLALRSHRLRALRMCRRSTSRC